MTAWQPVAIGWLWLRTVLNGPRCRRRRSLGAMAFKIIYADGSEKQHEDDDRYSFNKSGMVVIDSTRSGVRRILSPSAWHVIEDPEGTRSPSLPTPDPSGSRLRLSAEQPAGQPSRRGVVDPALDDHD
jgi:hypothetical protein